MSSIQSRNDGIIRLYGAYTWTPFTNYKPIASFRLNFIVRFSSFRSTANWFYYFINAWLNIVESGQLSTCEKPLITNKCCYVTLIHNLRKWKFNFNELICLKKEYWARFSWCGSKLEYCFCWSVYHNLILVQSKFCSIKN